MIIPCNRPLFGIALEETTILGSRDDDSYDILEYIIRPIICFDICEEGGGIKAMHTLDSLYEQDYLEYIYDKETGLISTTEGESWFANNAFLSMLEKKAIAEHGINLIDQDSRNLIEKFLVIN